MTTMINVLKKTRWQHVIFIFLIAFLAFGSEGCKSTGKLSKKERKAQIETAKTQLQPIIDGTSTLSLDGQDQLISGITAKNYNDADLNQMLLKASQKVKQGKAEQAKQTAIQVDAARATLLDLILNKDNKTADQIETELNRIKGQNLRDTEIDDLIVRVEKKIGDMRSFNSSSVLPVKTQLENAFTTIANAAKTGNLSHADATIQSALQFFSSDDVPVLIIISREGSVVDYDKPTTINRYLHFLRDQKASNNAIDAMQLDANGKIKELDLIKKQ